MKKITTIFILAAVFVVGLFAEPNVPKLYKGEDEYLYISNDFKYSYEIYAGRQKVSKLSYAIYFIKCSLETERCTTLIIYFDNESQLDNFTKKIEISDIEDEFTKIQKQMIKNGSKPNEDFLNGIDLSNPPQNIIYKADGTKLK